MNPNRYNYIELRVDLKVMAMNKYSTHPKALKLKPHYEIKFSHIQ